MSIVITGASGFVGINLINRLSEKGYDIVALDIDVNNKKIGNVQWAYCDVTNKDNIEKFLNKDVEIVYHFAGVVGVKNYLKNPLDVINVNFESTRHIADLARKYDYGIVFASTSEIYGKNSKIPWSEDDDRVLGSTKKERWIYSSAKALSEHLLFSESDIYGFRNIIVRFFNLYGEYQKPINVVPRMITSLILNKKITIYDNGLQTRCFTYVGDAINAILKLVNSPNIKNDVFNIGSNEETSIKKLAEIIVKILNKSDTDIEYINTSNYLGEGYEDIPRRVPDVSKIYNAIGWKAETKLEDGLNKTIDWYKKNKNWFEKYY